MKNFALIGAGGYVAPRHMQAIRDTGSNLVAAMDIHDSVGVLDSYFPQADFFTSFERFERHLEKLKREGRPVDYVVVCSPNYLHDTHVRFGLKLGADVICEKPVVLNPWNVDALMETERETGRKVFTILQLRLHPAAIALRQKIEADGTGKRYKVNLQYITPRGNWYHASWKGDEQKSGGIATNIGVHFFDLLVWLFGSVRRSTVTRYSAMAAAGELELENADVNWLLSIEERDLPEHRKDPARRTFRQLVIDGDVFDFSEGLAELHSQSYAEILFGKGFSLKETKEVIKLVHDLRISKIG